MHITGLRSTYWVHFGYRREKSIKKLLEFFDGELPYRFKLIRLMRFVSELFVFQFWIFYCSTEVNTTKGCLQS